MKDKSVAQYLTLLTEEYKTLRDESKQASINMLVAIQIGATVIGVAMASAFTKWNDSAAVVIFAFMLVIPLLAALTVFLWIGEAIRFKRVGDYICLLEQKVGYLLETQQARAIDEDQWMPIQRQTELSLKLVPSPSTHDPLNWERWLRNTRPHGYHALLAQTSGHQTLIYLMRFAFFPAIMLLSFTIGWLYAKAPGALIPPTIEPWLGWIRHIGETIVSITVLLTVLSAWRLGSFPDQIKRPPPKKTSRREQA